MDSTIPGPNSKKLLSPINQSHDDSHKSREIRSGYKTIRIRIRGRVPLLVNVSSSISISSLTWELLKDLKHFLFALHDRIPYF